jgi:phosphoribosylformylglycinamidine synthase
LLASVLATAAERGHLGAAHDLSDGGLAQTLVESCLRHNLGAKISFPAEVDPFVLLFSESAGRALVAVPRGHEEAFLALCTERNLAHAKIGVVDGRSGALEVTGQFRIRLDELRQAHSATLPDLFGHVVGVAGQENVAEADSAQVGEAAVPEDDLAAQAEQAARGELAAEALVATDTTDGVDAAPEAADDAVEAADEATGSATDVAGGTASKKKSS